MKMTHFALAGLFLLLAAGIYLTVQTDMDGRMAQQQAESERALAERDKKLAQLEKAIQDQAAPADPAADLNATVQNKTAAAVAQARNGIARVKTALEQPLPGDPEVTDLAAAAKNAVDGATDNVLETADEVAKRILEKEQDVLTNTVVGDERLPGGIATLTGTLPDSLEPRLTNIQTQIMAQPAIARIENANAAANEGFVILDRGLNANLAKGDAFAVRRGTALIGRVVIGETMEETRCVAEVMAKHLVPGMVLQKGDEIIKFDQ